MKKTNNKLTIILIVVIYLSLVIIPYINFVNYDDKNNEETEYFSPNLPSKKTDIAEKENEFLIYDVSSGEISSILYDDFLISSLATEMDLSMPVEALKAQCVASFSYYSYLKKQNSGKKYHIEYNSKDNIVLSSKEKLQELWADKFEQNYNSYKDIVNSVKGECLSYKGEIACSSFFNSSNGSTESAMELWGEDIPYLIQVASPSDMLSSGKETVVTYLPVDVKKIVEENWSYAKFDYTIPYNQWFSDLKYTTGASITSVNICGFSITGEEARNAFALASPCFKVEYDGTKFIFTARGNGSLVGMSKTGAGHMASEGATYKEILSWYFPKTTIEKMEY